MLGRGLGIAGNDMNAAAGTSLSTMLMTNSTIVFLELFTAAIAPCLERNRVMPSVRDRVPVVIAEIGTIPLPPAARSGAEVLTYYNAVRDMFLEVGPIPWPGPDVPYANVLGYYGAVRDGRMYGTEPAMQSKLVIVGDVGAGKTSLLRLLRTGVAKPAGAAERTQGIDVHCWRPGDAVAVGAHLGPYVVLACLGDDRYTVARGDDHITLLREDLIVHVPLQSRDDYSGLAIYAFDMGGHEAYRGTQQMHIAGDALYLIVFDASKPAAACAARCARSCRGHACGRDGCDGVSRDTTE
jgi:hypothetical protein